METRLRRRGDPWVGGTPEPRGRVLLGVEIFGLLGLPLALPPMHWLMPTIIVFVTSRSLHVSCKFTETGYLLLVAWRPQVTSLAKDQSCNQLILSPYLLV